MIKAKMLYVWKASLVFFLIGIVTRSDEALSQKVKYRKNTSLSFDEVDIEGEGKNPLGAVIMSTKTQGSGSLIRIRKHWRKEMVKSANLISNKK